METPPPQPPSQPAKTLRVGRFEAGLNIAIQTLALLVIVVFANLLGSKYFRRWSVVANQRVELGQMTKSVITELEKPLQVIVYFSSPGEVESEARTMLREYEIAAGKKITVEDVDPTANYVRAKELAAKYNFGGAENVLILDYDGRSLFINTVEMAEMEHVNPMEMMQRRRPPEMLAFKGEEVLTNKILQLVEPKQHVLYLTAGHGEPDIAGPHLDMFKEIAQRQNLRLASLNIANVDTVPDDASMVIVIGPRFDFTDRDLKIFTEYWNRKGSFFFTVGPTRGKTPNLYAWLGARGVRPMDNHVLKVETIDGQRQILSAGLVSKAESPITKEHGDTAMLFLGPTQSINLDRALETTDKLKLTGLVVAPEGFWGDKKFQPGDEIAFYDPEKDDKGPFTLGVSVEKGASSDPGVKLATSKLVFIGNSDFLTDQGARAAPVALDLAFFGTNWLINRQNLITIPAKPKDARVINLTPEQVTSIRHWVLLFIPLMVAAFGLFYLWIRNQRNVFVLIMWLGGSFLLLVGVWYALLWALKKEEARDFPQSLMIAVAFATVLVIASIVVNTSEGKKREAAKG